MTFQDNLDERNWGLDRIDGVLNQEFYYGNWTGAGVRVYIIDSGIQISHEEFVWRNTTTNETESSRASCGWNFVSDVEGDEDCEDNWGHGTHAAALIGTNEEDPIPETLITFDFFHAFKDSPHFPYFGLL